MATYLSVPLDKDPIEEFEVLDVARDHRELRDREPFNVEQREQL